MSSAQAPAFTSLDVELMDLSLAVVTREIENVDILIEDASNRLTVIIENKVDSDQHSNQLQRYYDRARLHNPGHSIQGVYLTLGGDDAENEHYVSLSYEAVHGLVQELLDRSDLLIGDFVRSSLIQYNDLLGRHFMIDTELQKLCANLYRKHRHAIDILRENLPDDRTALAAYLQEIVSSSLFASDSSNPKFVRFYPKEFLSNDLFTGASEWTESRLLLLFEFRLQADSISLELRMGGGADEKRRRILESALKHKPLFCPETTLYRFQRLYRKSIAKARDYEFGSDSVKKSIDKSWNEFLSRDFPQIMEALSTFN